MQLTRGLDPALLDAISNPAGFYPVALCSSVWPDGTARIHSGRGDMSWDGETWAGAADIIADVSAGAEGVGPVGAEAALTLVGQIATVLGYADPASRGGAVGIWLGATTTPGGTVLIGEPFRVFSGAIGSNAAEIDATTDMTRALLTVTAESGPAARESAAIWHSDEDQKARDATDTIFERLAFAAAWRQSPPQFPEGG